MPLLLNSDTLRDVLTALGHHRLWVRTVSYGPRYPDLTFIVTWGNRCLAQWSERHNAWTVTDAIRCIPLSGRLTPPPGEPVDDEWVFNRMIRTG
ncbi:hypothetical protein [Dickeya parazeae]|uniref:hypothetical protein n=1 Tax=Dickeya parazeae TaxID=2893572 RepID=UPI001AEC785C|nr:hypothetical protein [Dickeya parazeae]MBP2834753.1 hypothetical protein [Dickeya parazeae]